MVALFLFLKEMTGALALVFIVLAPSFDSLCLCVIICIIWNTTSTGKLVTVFYQVKCTLFYIENDAEIFPANYTWKVADKGLKMANNNLQ